MSGAAEGVKKAVGDAIDHPLDTIANVATQYVSLGTVSYEGDGKFGKGILTKAADEGIGELTGRNLARDQAAKADQAVETAAKTAATNLTNQRQQAQNQDIAASNSVQGIRNSSVAQQAAMMRYNSLGSSPQRDFLGL